MIINVNQVKANFAANFEILIDNELAYTGASSWISSMLSNKLFNKDGNIIMESCFMAYEKLVNSIPFKWAWSERQSANHAVFEHGTNPIGLFYSSSRGFFERISGKYVLKYKDYELFLYPINRGRHKYIPVFLDDAQIGQINKDNLVHNNKDKYVILLLDEYVDLSRVLSLFTIYYDSHVYGNRGVVKVGYTSTSYK